MIVIFPAVYSFVSLIFVMDFYDSSSTLLTHRLSRSSWTFQNWSVWNNLATSFVPNIYSMDFKCLNLHFMKVWSSLFNGHTSCMIKWSSFSRVFQNFSLLKKKTFLLTKTLCALWQSQTDNTKTEDVSDNLS